MIGTANIKDDNPLPHGSSHWDKLPKEIQDMVFEHASPLTRFLNDRLEVGSDEKDLWKIHRLWLEAFDMDWPGDLRLLPRPKNFSLRNHDLVRVKSRSMYERLCTGFPKATSANAEFAKTDKETELLVQSGEPEERRRLLLILKPPLRLLHIPLRHMWFDYLGDTLDEFPYARANDCIIEGHFYMLRHLINSGRIKLKCIKRVCMGYFSGKSLNAIDIAAERGHIDILMMLHTVRSQKASTMAMDYAAEGGHLDVIKWLHENRTEGCTTLAMDGAANNGHLDVIKFLHGNRTEGCTTNAMNSAARNGNLAVVKFLHENRREGCTTEAMDWAARNGDLAVVKWLHENRTEGCTFNAMNSAARNRDLADVKWLHENRTEGCTTDAMDLAACNRDLAVVKWLHENRTERCTTKAMDEAARDGDLDLVKFLYENRTEGCTNKAMDDAARNGHFDVVKYLHENRKFISMRKAVEHAARGNHSEIVRYLLDVGSEGFDDNIIIRCKNPEIIEMLVASLSVDRKRAILKKAISRDKYGLAVDTLRKSLGITVV